MRRVYLDHNATTPIDPRVASAMSEAITQTFGNPSSVHWYGQQARAAVEEARGAVAELIGAQASEIVFTGSGTEADNMALRGATAVAPASRAGIAHSTIEHHAVIDCARSLAGEGRAVETLRVGATGVVELEELGAKVGAGTALVAVMLANNETGVVQPIDEVVRLAHERGALVLCDAVQGVGKLAVDVQALGVDLLALSAHKLGGPKGVGALYVRRGTRLAPLLRGGSQERHRRAGTENVVGIVGLGRAAQIARAEWEGEARRQSALRDRLEQELLAIPDTWRNGDGTRVPNTTNVSFAGVEAESLVMALDLAGVAVSTGAACASGAVEPSHVLKAMGLPPGRAQAAVRFSVGRTTTSDDVEQVVAAVVQAVARQRQRTSGAS